MKKNVALAIGVLILFILISIPFIRITKTPIDDKMDSIKIYEQGLWDGFNKTIKYLDMKGVIKDTIRININQIGELDSVLHSK